MTEITFLCTVEYIHNAHPTHQHSAHCNNILIVALHNESFLHHRFSIYYYDFVVFFRQFLKSDELRRMFALRKLLKNNYRSVVSTHLLCVLLCVGRTTHTHRKKGQKTEENAYTHTHSHVISIDWRSEKKRDSRCWSMFSFLCTWWPFQTVFVCAFRKKVPFFIKKYIILFLVSCFPQFSQIRFVNAQRSHIAVSLYFISFFVCSTYMNVCVCS